MIASRDRRADSRYCVRHFPTLLTKTSERSGTRALPVLTSFLTHDLPHTIALNNGKDESSSCMGDDTSHQISQHRKLEITQYNTAKFIQTRQKMAAPMHRDTAREKSFEYR